MPGLRPGKHELVEGTVQDELVVLSRIQLDADCKMTQVQDASTSVPRRMMRSASELCEQGILGGEIERIPPTPFALIPRV